MLLPTAKVLSPLTAMLRRLKKSACAQCESLTSIILPNTITTIGEKAFEGCNKLVSITFPNTVTRIEKWAFLNCFGLKSVKFEGTACQYAIGTDAFLGPGSYTPPIELILPEGWNYNTAPADNTSAWHGGYFNSNLYSTEEATDKQNAIAEITAIMGEYSTSAYLQSFIAEDVENINNAANRPELNGNKKAAIDKLTIAVPSYAGGDAAGYQRAKDELPTDAQDAAGHTVIITKGDKTLKLVNPEKVEFGKQ